MSRQIVLDTETTGLDPRHGHRIIEIACLEVIDRRVTGEQFHCYINPQRDVDEGAFKVHGISRDFLQDKPLFADIVDEFIAFIQHSEVVIHNAPFDVGFINHEFQLLKPKRPRVTQICKVLDTLVMAREKHPGQRNNLDALCKRYGVDNTNRDLHGALIDTDLLAQVYLAMTRGQDCLFAGVEDGASTAKQQAEAENTNLAVDGQDLPVIKADEMDLAAHRDYFS